MLGGFESVHDVHISNIPHDIDDLRAHVLTRPAVTQVAPRYSQANVVTGVLDGHDRHVGHLASF